MNTTGYLHGAYFEGQDIGMRVAWCVRGYRCAPLKRVPFVRNAHPYEIQEYGHTSVFHSTDETII